MTDLPPGPRRAARALLWVAAIIVVAAILATLAGCTDPDAAGTTPTPAGATTTTAPRSTLWEDELGS